jgi:GNAT superfamily N-acetyltransferase
MAANRTVRFSIYRYDPDKDAKPYMQDLEVELLPTDKMLLDAIMRIENASFASDAWSIQNMHDELVGAERFYVVAYATAAESEDLIGYAGLAKSMAASSADIQTIAVSFEQRGKGLGRKLIAEARLIARPGKSWLEHAHAQKGMSSSMASKPPGAGAGLRAGAELPPREAGAPPPEPPA